MANIIPQFDLSNIQNSDEFMRYCSQVVGQILAGINGNLDFTNLLTQQVSVTFPSTPDTNLEIRTSLGKTGVKFIVTSKDVACDIYRGTGDTNQVMYLKSTVGGASVTLLLF